MEILVSKTIRLATSSQEMMSKMTRGRIPRTTQSRMIIVKQTATKPERIATNKISSRHLKRKLR